MQKGTPTPPIVVVPDPAVVSGYHRRFADSLLRYSEGINRGSLYNRSDRQLLFDELQKLVHVVPPECLGESMEKIAAMFEGYLSMTQSLLFRFFEADEVALMAMLAYTGVVKRPPTERAETVPLFVGMKTTKPPRGTR